MTKNPQEVVATRGQWSRMGFVFAASGSAIGLGNIVFFPANAYRFGGGAFYLPYLISLLAVGIPLLILELGLGHQQRRAYPAALRQVAGPRGEFLGWWALANTTAITVYYVAILGWVVGMFVGSLGPLWEPATELSQFGLESLPNPAGFFFNLLSSWGPAIFVMGIWAVNALIVRRGTASIERAVKIFVPLMWILMILLLVRGVTLPGGKDGVWNLFEPNFHALTDATIWQGAVSQIFFTLSIGFGVMTAYGSYLPRKSDQTNNAVLISCLNCGFEYVAGIAIFGILFAFAAVPQASTISMTFFIVPQGIGQLPGGPPIVTLFGSLFFFLLLLAGLSSTVSMVESLVSALLDKFAWNRAAAVAWVCVGGAFLSFFFTLPQVIDPNLDHNGTIGLTLVDLLDHWAFSYGLLIVGLSQCLLLGQRSRIRRIRLEVNHSSHWKLGIWYEVLIGRDHPILPSWDPCMGVVPKTSPTVSTARSYVEGLDSNWNWFRPAPYIACLGWVAAPLGLAFFLTKARSHHRADSGDLSAEPSPCQSNASSQRTPSMNSVHSQDLPKPTSLRDPPSHVFRPDSCQ